MSDHHYSLTAQVWLIRLCIMVHSCSDGMHCVLAPGYHDVIESNVAAVSGMQLGCVLCRFDIFWCLPWMGVPAFVAYAVRALLCLSSRPASPFRAPQALTGTFYAKYNEPRVREARPFVASCFPVGVRHVRQGARHCAAGRIHRWRPTSV